MHHLFTKKINEIYARLKQLTMDIKMPTLNKAKEEGRLYEELAMYRHIEEQVLKNIQDYQTDKQVDLIKKELYYAKLTLISKYKQEKGIVDVVKDGMVVDTHDYSYDVNFLNIQLSLSFFKSLKYLYYKYLRNAINSVYFNVDIEETYEEDLELVNQILSKKDSLNADQINKLNMIKKIIISNIELRKLGNPIIVGKPVKK